MMQDLEFEKKLKFQISKKSLLSHKNPMYMSHIGFFILFFGRQVVKIGAPKKNGLN